MKRGLHAIRHHNLATFGASILTLVLAISVTSAVPISASGELTRPVTVGNPANNPVFTRNVDDVARNFVTFALDPSTADQPFGSSSAIFRSCYTVPSGRVLVIQSVTYFARLVSADEHLVQLGLNSTSGAFIEAPLVPPVSNGSTEQYQSGSFPGPMYSTGSINCIVQRNTPVADGSTANVSVSGYLLSYP